jgi:hypothetical protein
MFRFGTICLAEGSRKDAQFADEILNYSQGLLKISIIAGSGFGLRFPPSCGGGHLSCFHKMAYGIF